MAFKKITFNEDHLKLISSIKFEAFEFDCKSDKSRFGWGIDQYSLFGGTYVMEDVALALGHFDEYIRGTEESPLGRQYPKALEDYWWSLYQYIVDNMEYIIDLVFTFATQGGISVGTYKLDNNGKWSKVE